MPFKGTERVFYHRMIDLGIQPHTNESQNREVDEPSTRLQSRAGQESSRRSNGKEPSPKEYAYYK